ncbi:MULTISPECIES: hypothetical protein [unclassified Streptomyces]|uniref:hypothetical protein n=1 Tax=unclassified Streptomyces TaxID=2593676 RepID=UPI00225B0285|nr:MULTISPECIES: hypothetical protein [unclassified Streptomyces]MCX4528771.1 hypothetical protein [Streptomyces sp. NBC_01551]MCX4540621.1 hypothetical protein [Streptomyces sp. NBC_01565]
MDMADSGVARGMRALPALVVVAGALTGCSLLSPFTTCEGTGAAVTSLRQDPILELRPGATRELKGFEGVSAECLDDSGDAWMYANRLYVAPVDEGTVLRFYREAAPAQGWTLRPDRWHMSEEMAGFCLSQGEGQVRELDVMIMPTRQAKEMYDYQPPAGPVVETLYTVEVGASVDGTPTEC